MSGVRSTLVAASQEGTEKQMLNFMLTIPQGPWAFLHLSPESDAFPFLTAFQI